MDFRNQRAALLGENLRRVLQLGSVALGLSDTLAERGSLVASTLPAFDPTGRIGGEGRQPAVGEFGFTHNGLLRLPGALHTILLAELTRLTEAEAQA